MIRASRISYWGKQNIGFLTIHSGGKMTDDMTVEKALLYEKYRLPYADEMVDDLLQRTGAVSVTADIGSGTGQLARLFAESCTQVYAVEPDPAMRQVAAEVSKVYPNIYIMDARAEQTTLPENSIDLIVIGNAFHRFQPEAIHELLRILKPSGWVAVIFYVFTNQAFADMLFPKLSQLESLASRSKQNWHQMPVEKLFGDHPIHRLHYVQSSAQDWEAFWGAARSGIEAPSPHDADFRRFEAINQEVFNAFAVDGRIRIDYEIKVSAGQPKS
jgi:ubiquinone/menaquinone biosynthesis C-methylase UbiE